MPRPAKAVATLIVIALPVVWVLFLWPKALGGPASYVVVSGHSMEPTLHANDLAVVQEQSDYQLGDVVAYHVPAGDAAAGSTVIHRITGGNARDGFIVKGDNNPLPDSWRPKPEDIVGEMSFHVPDGGRLLASLRQPLNLGIVVGSLTTLSLIGGGKMKRGRRGNHGSREGSNKGKGAGSADPSGLLLALGASVILTVAFTALAVYSFSRSARDTESVTQTLYEQTASFAYTAQVQPSSLYPSGVVGPVVAPPNVAPSSAEGAAAAAPSPSAAASHGPPIYTKLAHSLDVAFTYSIAGSALGDVSGDYSGALQIKASDDGWMQTVPVVTSTPFSGSEVAFNIPVDFAAVWSIIDAVESETGFAANAYKLSIIPRIHVTSKAGGQTTEAVYAPAFDIGLTRTQMTPSTDLARKDAKTISQPVVRTRHLDLLAFSPVVTTARWLSSGLTAAGLALAGALAAIVLMGLGSSEAARIRARYGSMLVNVSDKEAAPTGPKIDLGSMRDLVRLAQRDGRIIFHQTVGPDSHRYFVQDSTVTYQYATERSTPEALKESTES